MRIILLGPPGSGKGTQAKAMAEKLNLAHISTGEILRQNVLRNSELGRRAKEFMDKGALVPDELVSEMLTQRIAWPDVSEGFILDGYPRNINQAKTLDEVLQERNTIIDMVIYLDSSESVIIQRLTGRLVCSRCGANFHIKNMPPRKDEICDNCGGRLYQRSDDKEETIRKRLEVYRKVALELIEYYEEKKKLFRLSADEEAGVVLQDIIKLIERHHDSSKV